jgi:hypothetical protein
MFEKTIRETLAAIVKAYGRATRLSNGQISKKCYGNAVFLDDFFAGRQSMSVRKMDAVLTWFGANWPDGADRPTPRAVMMGVVVVPKKK